MFAVFTSASLCPKAKLRNKCKTKQFYTFSIHFTLKRRHTKNERKINSKCNCDIFLTKCIEKQNERDMKSNNFLTNDKQTEHDAKLLIPKHNFNLAPQMSVLCNNRYFYNRRLNTFFMWRHKKHQERIIRNTSKKPKLSLASGSFYTLAMSKSRLTCHSLKNKSIPILNQAFMESRLSLTLRCVPTYI